MAGLTWAGSDKRLDLQAQGEASIRLASVQGISVASTAHWSQGSLALQATIIPPVP